MNTTTHTATDFALPLHSCSPVLLLNQVGVVDLLILYLLLFVVLLGGQGRWNGVPGARGRAAHVLGAVELVNATGEQHAVAVQHHGALGTGLTGWKKRTGGDID